MPTLLLGITNQSDDLIAVGPPTAINGTELMAMAPDPVEARATSAALLDSLESSTELEVTYRAAVQVTPAVHLDIDIWIRGQVFEKLIVTSTDSARFPIEGRYQMESPGMFIATLKVG